MNVVITTEKLPIKLWVPDQTDIIDENVLQQFRNLANHPLAFKWIGAMPDYHLGYGMPIGGVFATRGGVVPNAVGVDIGCGMIAVRTWYRAEEFSTETLQKLRIAIHQRVPVGMGSNHKTAQVLPPRLMESDVRLRIVNDQRDHASYQLGTLGAGNHFIEIQKEGGYEDGRVWLMLHSGSRGIGTKVCNHYHKLALKFMDKYHSAIPDRDLAFLASDTLEYWNYLQEMNWCLAFAEENREAMLRAVFEAFQEVVGGPLSEVPSYNLKVDTHHNFVAKENHFGENVWVHRKGAVKATGLVTIPGSMGTASYIGEGLVPAESFNTCSHGAGRVLGRKAANKAITRERAEETMQGVVFGIRDGDFDEMPDAYKDIDAVMAAQADLVKPVHRLTPMAVVKG